MKPAWILLVGLSTWLTIAASAAAAERPNIVLFLVDDMGWMDCGAYGSKYYQTPHIDRFAERAMRFTSAYACPLCSPTRASILTGQYSARHGILTASGHQPPQPAGYDFLPDVAPVNRPMITPESKNYLEPAHTTLAEALRDAGYRTAHIGKWHLGQVPPYRPEQHGFDVAFHCAPDPGPPGGYFSPYGVIPEGTPSNKAKIGTITDGPAGEYIVDRQAAEAVKFISDSKASQKPFFLNLWCYGVHGPWGHKQKYTAEFAKRSDPRGLQGNPIMASMLRSVDECFGRIVDELDRQGLANDTIVIFYSDNGGNVHSNVPGTAKTAAAERNRTPALADWRKWAGDQPPTNNTPLREGKSSLYEGGVRVPMMWSWGDRIARGSTSEAIVGHIDIYPTLLELIGLAKPGGQVIDGVSIAPILFGKGKLDREAFFNFFPFRPHEGGVTVHRGDYKLMRWFEPGVPRELYNLREDIGETKNLAEQMPDKVRELDALIDTFLIETGALVPRRNPAYKAGAAAVTPQRGSTIRGLTPKFCTTTLVDGSLVVTGEGRNPFLGMAGLDQQGPVTLTLTARTIAGGAAKVQWRTADQEAFPQQGQIVEFTLPRADEPRQTVVKLPVEGKLIHMRLYLPVQNASVALDRIELAPANGESKAWEFARK